MGRSMGEFVAREAVVHPNLIKEVVAIHGTLINSMMQSVGCTSHPFKVSFCWPDYRSTIFKQQRKRKKGQLVFISTLRSGIPQEFDYEQRITVALC